MAIVWTPSNAPKNTAGPAPIRRPDSVRRTSTIDVTWPQGREGQSVVDARARDIATSRCGGPPVVLAEDRLNIVVGTGRTVVEIVSDPVRPQLAELVGAPGAGGFRKVMRPLVPGEIERATPLYLLLDDFSGASLVSTWAWSHWDTAWLEALLSTEGNFQKSFALRENICMGFTTGASGFRSETDRSNPPVPDLRNPDDPEGWHDFAHQKGAGFRRARWIDVWQDDMIRIESGFQDSSTEPTGGRVALHEYTLTASVDPATMTLAAIESQARILPYVECPRAGDNLVRLVGTPVAALRTTVLAELGGAAGCTHLNDVIRALADVSALARYLPEHV